MRYLAAVLCALTLLWVGGVQAKAKGMGEIKNNPIIIVGGDSARMTVVFSHQAHRNKDFNCIHCHHESSSNTPYSACRDCHATPGASERDPMSMYMAFHAPDTDRSCYGCHTRLAKKEPGLYKAFKGCRPCHSDFEAAKAAAASVE